MSIWRTKPLSAILAIAERKPLHRSLGAWHLTLLGIGGVIGTGIFVLTAEAAQRAGPGMLVSFAIAGLVSVVAGLCYAELAAMIPVSGSAYTYSYAVLGEVIAWLVGWALILEYAVAASAVAVGWSGYIVGLLGHLASPIVIPSYFASGPSDGGILNLPAIAISLGITVLLVMGTRESATVNAVLVGIKLLALGAFVWFAAPTARMENFHPFAPLGSTGIITAAASIFFAYVGFDAVSTAAEETRDPQCNLPIGLIASLAICTAIYLLVAAGAIGAWGAQPVLGTHGEILTTGSLLSQRCADLKEHPLACSHEALAYILRAIGHPIVGNLLGLAAGIALPTVILTMIYGQTRIFFVMSRDGLLPKWFSAVHPRFKTPYVVTWITGLGVAAAAACLPVDQLADISNSGTLFAFSAVSVAVLILRKVEPSRPRPFRTPLVWLTAPLSVLGCIGLFFFLPWQAQLLFPVWSAMGLILYFSYGYRHSYARPELDQASTSLESVE